MTSSIAQPSSVNHVGTILRRSLLVYIVILFFGDVAIYLSLAVSPRLEPQYWIGLLVVMAGILAWFSPRTRWEVFRTPVFFWCVGFLALTLILFAAIPTSHIEQLKERIRDVVLLTTLINVFLMLQHEAVFVKKLVLVAAVLGALFNLISLFYNDFLRPPNTIWPYRPGGFFINPNESAIALVLGMLLSVDVLPQRFRAPYCVYILAGVVATFSREALSGWLLATVCLCAFNVIKWRVVILYSVALIIIEVIVAIVVGKAHLLNASVFTFFNDQITRLYSTFGGTQYDPSGVDRWKVLKLGWKTFIVHPFVGNGIGSTYHWSMPISTHNMYLLYMDDYGIIGLFLYPLLIWCMLRGARGETRKLVWTMAIFLLFWGLFDHNIVQNYYSLFAISLTAAMSRISATESVPRTEAIPAEPASG